MKVTDKAKNLGSYTALSGSILSYFNVFCKKNYCFWIHLYLFFQTYIDICNSDKNKLIKAQIPNSISTKTTKIFKNFLSNSFSEFYLVYNRFHLKLPGSKLQNLRIAILGQFWLKLSISVFDQLKKMFSGKFYYNKIPPDHPEAIDIFWIRN